MNDLDLFCQVERHAECMSPYCACECHVVLAEDDADWMNPNQNPYLLTDQEIQEFVSKKKAR